MIFIAYVFTPAETTMPFLTNTWRRSLEQTAIIVEPGILYKKKYALLLKLSVDLELEMRDYM